MTCARARCFATVFAVVLSLGCAVQGQKVTSDIAYTSDASGTQLADLYMPAGAGPFPAIIYLHGGSWRSGSKRSFQKLGADLAAEGYVGFSINYDLRPHSWPLSLQESIAAISFVRAHAAEYRVDPARIVVLGTSAGGELASLAALDPQTNLAAAVILNGVFDLQSNAHVITRYLGGKCEDIGDTCRRASPQALVHAGAPPFFIGHGTADHVVAYAEAQNFSEALRQKNVPVTNYAAEGGPHMYWEKSAFYGANLAAVKSFLQSAMPDAKRSGAK